MLKAKDIMEVNVITISPEEDIAKAAKMLVDNGINGMPVVDKKGEVIGIICMSDLIAQQKSIPIPSLFTFLDGYIPMPAFHNIERDLEKIAATSVESAMTPKPVTLTPDSPIEDIADLIVDKHFHSLPVVEDGKLVGIVGKEDILRTLIKE
jgi:CBS domain-containing protein